MDNNELLKSNESYESVILSSLHQTDAIIEKSDFSQVTFSRCDFSSTEFKSCTFDKCQFKNCTMPVIKVTGSKFDKVTFNKTKITGIDWTAANTLITFAIKFIEADCSYSVFAGLNLALCSFEKSILYETDFSEIKAKGVSFESANVDRAIFRHANLQGCNFKFVKNLSLDITQNFVKDAIFSKEDSDLLLKSVGIILSDELPPTEEDGLV